ncbi:MAG: hypothetical protein NTU69_07860, partial [Proteobacteria bacterium]|nr:hypothetical protein [Pseudomonadota bacterium]
TGIFGTAACQPHQNKARDSSPGKGRQSEKASLSGPSMRPRRSGQIPHKTTGNDKKEIFVCQSGYHWSIVHGSQFMSCPTHSLTDMYIYYNTQSMPEAIFSISRFEILTLFADVKNKQRSGIFNKKALEGKPSRA